jgi:hypothetical protein
MNLQAIIDKFVERPGYLKKGAGYLANLFKTDKKTIYKAKLSAKDILSGSKEAELQNIIAEQEEYINKKFNEKGECFVDGKTYRRIVTLEDLIEYCEIDTKEWEIASWECNKWEVGAKNAAKELVIKPLFQVKAKLVKPKDATVFSIAFQKFLKDYTPAPVVAEYFDFGFKKEKALLVFPKQDAHFNRVDIKGRNNIQDRFTQIEEKTIEILQEASAFNDLEKITYIVGSDQFNSEWNSMTTGGTPQENLMSHHNAFRAICNHEVTNIENLLEYADGVELLFVPGNHDEYVGWHLIDWLKCYYRNNDRVIVNDDETEPRKYERYGDTAVMYNHGDKLNGKELAVRFPVEFRKEWGKCNHYYIFLGDKHNELSGDHQGIKHYRVPALTPSKSKWEHKSGYLTPGEMQAFLIREKSGLHNIYTRLLE